MGRLIFCGSVERVGRGRDEMGWVRGRNEERGKIVESIL
jgi:hypothetical protein